MTLEAEKYHSLTHQELLVEYDGLASTYIKTKQELDQLKRMVFGSKHERFLPSVPPEQLSLPLEVETAQPAPQKVEVITYTRERQPESNKVATGRMKLPSSLPRERVIIEPDEDVSGLKKIGEEITEELEYVPGKLFVRQYVRNKYARPQGEGVLIGELPSRPIDKGMAGPGLLAQIAIDKYVDHLPLNRQMQRYEREGLKLPYSTFTGWIAGASKLIVPLFEAFRAQGLSGGYLQVDETTIKVLDKDKKGTTHRGYYWVYRSPLENMVLFDYREGRGREGPNDCLKDFEGYLQSDGYEVYEAFGKRQGITLLGCMAHARRKFDEARDNDGAKAEYALAMFQKLYAMERKAKEQALPADGLYSLRQKEALPILKELKEWMIGQYPKVLPQSPIGKAISYSVERWDKLSLYTTNGILKIDNNLVENAIRPVAIGRKNYMFAGSHEGARRAAMFYSFFGTCKINGINTLEWFTDVLTRLPSHKVNQLHELFPQNWKSHTSTQKQ